jgi:hypothetical protein
MKRSEMLELMKNRLHGADSFKSDLAVVDYILRAMEEAGMSPPGYTCLNEGNIKPTIYGSYMRHGWEPEDEEK